MSSAFPTLTGQYSSNGSTWSGDLGPAGAGDCSEITMSLRELVNGTGLTEIILNNLNGKYMAGVFAPWPQEAGLGYWWKWTINGVGPWYGRAVDLSPDLSTKGETLHVTVAMMDDPLKNYYLTNVVAQDQICNMITYGCQEYGPPATGINTGNSFTMGGVTYTVNTSAAGLGPVYGSYPPFTGPIATYVQTAGPVVNYDCSRSRMYAIDFIKDILVNANDPNKNLYGWSGYVDSTQGPFATTMYLFPQAAKSYASNIIYGTNVSTIKNSRNILRSKNFVEYAGTLSNAEPPLPRDVWTENDLSFWGKSSTSPQISQTHYCPTLGKEVYQPCVAPFVNAANQGIGGQYLIDTYSIFGTGNAVSLDLDLKAALGESFNAFFRNATSLNFYYKLLGPLLNLAGSANVQLKDGNGWTMQSTSGLNASSAGGQITGQVWNSYSAPVGSQTQYFTGLLAGLGINSQLATTTLFWTTVAQGSVTGGFDWSDITDIIFNATGVVGQNVSLYLDHLYFTQSYQPTTSGIDNDALNNYGQRMQFYDASMFNTYQALQSFSNYRTLALSPPTMQIDVTTSLGPEAETNTGGKGFQPGWCFPAGNVQVSNYGYNAVAWRAIQVDTHVKVAKDGGCTTRFILVPASTTGIGVDMARFDPRRNW